MPQRMDRRTALKACLVSAAVSATQPRDAGAQNEPTKPPASAARERLADHPVTHGGIQRVHHSRLDTQVYGQTCIRYLRFGHTVPVQQIELRRLVYGRAIPQLPVHPAHVTLSVLDASTLRWKTVRDIELPPDPAILGEGLSQSMSAEEMEKHIGAAASNTAFSFDLEGVETDHLRVVCDREHPTWPNHGECNGGEFNVPFGALNEFRAYGPEHPTPLDSFASPRILTCTTVRPKAPKGMKTRILPAMVLFESKWLSIGFSLRRPMLMHLGWDALGKGQAKNNRLFVSRRRSSCNATGGVSGPLLRTLRADYPAPLWTGEVSVEGNRVSYTNLQAVEGLRIDAAFTVGSDGFTIEITQDCAQELPVIEAEAWRLAWDISLGITGMVATPTQRLGRNGDVLLPGLWTTDGVGCLSCRVVDGDPGAYRMQVESYRESNCVTGGLVFGAHPGPERCQVVLAGKRRVVLEFKVANLAPTNARPARRYSEGLRRHWATVFSCFRPEYRGFSNHAASVNCHLSQGPPIEIVAHTQPPEYGPNPLDLARFTVGRALLDGGGYGYHRTLYLDTDPVLLSAAGRIHQAGPDLRWLREVAPGLVAAAERVLGQIGNEGLLVCQALSGNLDSFRWSSNSMDVVGFGHIDGYVNAWAYRGLRNAAALLDELPDGKERATRCRQAAARLREHFGAALFNPETGWVAGWRSRDGQLHDYGFTWVNGAALAFGLLDMATARSALLKLEQARKTAGLPDARLGIPCNLLPIRSGDQMWTKILKQLQPTFETYTDGSLSGWPATYYLRALAIAGLKEPARKLAREMAEGYAAGVFNGGNGQGSEFRSWEGLPTGYEGTLIGCFGPLYGIAIEEGALHPPCPEWWPENG